MAEEWKRVIGYEGAYEVSDLGHIRNCREVKFGPKGDFLRPQKAGNLKYYIVNLHANGHSKVQLIHRIVAQAFLGSCPDGYEVNHKDGHKFNNAASNLEYITHQENARHAAAHGLTLKGERNPTSKLTEEAVKSIRQSQETTKALADKFYVSRGLIESVIAGRTWKHLPSGSRRFKPFPSAKLELDQVMSIRESDLPYAELARIFKVNEETIRKASLGQTWKRLGGQRNKRNFGERHHNAKLNEEDIKLIRNSHHPNKELANYFGVDASTISNIKTFKAWRHVI